ncbi:MULTISPECIES: Qat anti-phage system ATPase QatA [Klebsiella/Raoultella group]|uniref:Qat anti-phage system ATPase QatA n=1 Tax=Klebsiella/Raoultella group TaxID=2890311 RepID=UPI0019150AA8|nr:MULTISPECIES: Qat anti-phage system ATPase QatA [Klebsiella/Raoultella group]MDC7944850.1 KAP family NTPase [Raoultella ornithinolytica]QQM79408.1 NTPase KAP [Klebsiella quasipneumoniae]
MFLNDQETATDLLYYSAIANTVVRLVNETPDAPITIGVHGDWGAGKSSVLKMLEAACKKKDRTHCIWFNGWTFEGFEDAKTVIIETIVEDLVAARPTSTKVADAAKKVLRRIDWLKMARKAGGLAFTAFTGIPTLDQIKGLYELATNFVSTPQDKFSAADFKAFAEKAADFIKEADTDNNTLPKHIHAFREEFRALLDAAEIEKLVVIVDDLDRCLPKTAIETLEAIRLFLFVEKTAFVIGADEAMIEYAVKDHFPDLPQSIGPVSYARNYLEKLIQVPFRIPALGSAETRIYTTLLLVENALGTKDDQFKALLTKARDEMKRPWISRGLDRDAVMAALKGKIPEVVENALLFSLHVTPMLSSGTHGNPRQIKRFLNSMMLRQAIADERGFGSDIKRPILAKIMLAERFYPNVYGKIVHLVSNHPEGKPEALAQFETLVRGGLLASKNDADSKEDVPESEDVQNWLKIDWAVGWAKSEPALSGEDLRPYVFVTRDKHSMLSSLVVSGHLTPMMEKLLGPKIGMVKIKEGLEKLNAPDADELFEMLSEKLLREDSFSRKPKGFEGLEYLVETQPHLQRRLIDFARRIPVKKAGGWLATRIAQSLVDPTLTEEYSKLIQEWASQGENLALSKSAKATLQLSGYQH